MAANIVIDGYNMIRQSDELIGLEAISLEEGRTSLVRLLAGYNKAKGHDITVVFDGWQSDNIGTSRERAQGINIIYSGRGEKADEVIKRIAGEMRDRVVVVTSDREIEKYAQKKGSVVIPSGEFEMKVRMACGGGSLFEGEEDGPMAGTKKKGPSHRLSREERKKRGKMGKL